MIKYSSKIRTGFKYFYLIIFFALLAGFFHPLITDSSFELVIFGIFILFVGLGGGILLYKSTFSEKRQIMYFGLGFVLIAVSLAFIFQFNARI